VYIKPLWPGVVQRPVYRRLSPKSVVTVDFFKLSLANNKPESRTSIELSCAFLYRQLRKYDCNNTSISREGSGNLPDPHYLDSIFFISGTKFVDLLGVYLYESWLSHPSVSSNNHELYEIYTYSLTGTIFVHTICGVEFTVHFFSTTKRRNKQIILKRFAQIACEQGAPDDDDCFYYFQQ